MVEGAYSWVCIASPRSWSSNDDAASIARMFGIWRAPAERRFSRPTRDRNGNALRLLRRETAARRQICSDFRKPDSNKCVAHIQARETAFAAQLPTTASACRNADSGDDRIRRAWDSPEYRNAIRVAGCRDATTLVVAGRYFGIVHGSMAKGDGFTALRSHLTSREKSGCSKRLQGCQRPANEGSLDGRD